MLQKIDAFPMTPSLFYKGKKDYSTTFSGGISLVYYIYLLCVIGFEF